jgi:hypothetical protein
MTAASPTPDRWVLLAYRLPRIPSTPRSAVWRKLRRLGVAQLTDGLVALPADDRTKEAFEWMAEEIIEYGGEATVWVGQPGDTKTATVMRARMKAAITAEYEAVAEEATTTLIDDEAVRRRVAARLRRELARIHARDFFPPAARRGAERAVDHLVATTDTRTRTSGAKR